MKTKLSLSFIVLFLFFCISLNAQNVHQVAAGQGVISAAYANANAGDIIELTTSGGQYIEVNPITITKDITIRAASGLAEKPVIYSTATNTFNITTGGLTVDGIILNGTFHGNVIGGYPFAINALQPDSITSSDFSLKLDNCEIRNFTASNGKGIFSTDATLSPMDSIIVTNCVFDSLTGYAIYLKTTKGAVYPGGFKYFKIENCLITHVIGDDGMAMYVQPASNDSSYTPAVIINHVTVVDMKGRGIYSNKVAGAICENSIVANVADTSKYAFYISPNNSPYGAITTVTHCLYYNANYGATADTVIDLINADPMFADTANGDYSLKAGSPGKNAGTDGLDLGYIPGGITTGVRTVAGQTPSTFNLGQNYPNPFNPSTSIQFNVPKSGIYTIKVYNLLGQMVAKIFDQNIASGSYRINFNASSLSSGVYLYVLKGNNVYMAKKMILLK